MISFIYFGRTDQLTLSQALQRLFSLSAQGHEWVIVERDGIAEYHVFEAESCQR